MAMRKRKWTPGACLCVVCGDPVPEGKQVCPICEDAAQLRDFEAAMGMADERPAEANAQTSAHLDMRGGGKA